MVSFGRFLDYRCHEHVKRAQTWLVGIGCR